MIETKVDYGADYQKEDSKEIMKLPQNVPTEQLSYSHQSRPAEGPPSLHGAVWAVAGCLSCSHGALGSFLSLSLVQGWPPPDAVHPQDTEEQLRNTGPNQERLGLRRDSLRCTGHLGEEPGNPMTLGRIA